MPVTRRSFVRTSAALLLPHRLTAQASASLYPSSRPDVAAIDHDRILAAASQALTAAQISPTTDPATLLLFSRQTSALAAAFHLTHDDRYASRATLNLRPWLITPTTRLSPNPTTPHFEAVLDTLPLAEMAQALPFLANSAALLPEEVAQLHSWFKAYLDWLTTSRTGGLARDQKDHHSTSWLLQVAAFARLTSDDAALRDLRHHFKTATLRAQLVAGGTFPHELVTPYPYRNSLFALDLLAASCLLLSTPFENLWEFELQDGPGLRSAIARHFPYIQDRGTWPYRADLDHFLDLPVRNPSLLFAARAYTRPEYAALWKTLNPDPTFPDIQRTFPISQPILWVAKPNLRT